MIPIAEIIALLEKEFAEVEVVSTSAAVVKAPCSLNYPIPGGVCFFNSKRWINASIDTASLALLIAPNNLPTDQRSDLVSACRKTDTALVLMPKPRAGFIAIVNQFFIRGLTPGIHPTANVDPTARISPTARIGAGSVIGPAVEIGAFTEISELVVIDAKAKIGTNCYIAPGVKIGQRGFGYERQRSGEMVHFPHLGSVVIGNYVEIGANTCIDRGTIDDTIIHDRVKIDNLVHVSHNVEIESDTVVIANSMIGGSVKIGQRSWISPSVNIINGISIGSDVLVGMSATVVKPVPDGQTVAGSPAVELSEFVRQRAILKVILTANQDGSEN